MKRIAFAIAAFVFALAVEAATFSPWKSSDAAAIRSALAEPGKSLGVQVGCVYRIAALESPDSVKDWPAVKSLVAAYLNGKGHAAPDVIYYASMVAANAGRPELVDACLADPEAASHWYVVLFVKGLKAAKLGIVQTGAQRRAALVAAIDVCLVRSYKDKACLLLGEYIGLTAGDDDADVLPVLRRFYRLALPKLADAAWKPFVVQLSLALKSRGEDVK